MELSSDQIDYIQKDINYRGIVYDQLEEELLDHVCTLVEEKMAGGMKFIDAYDEVMQSFGSELQIQEIQSQTLNLSNNNTKIMLKNYFKIALRSLSKHKFYSFINVAGLAVGLACCLIIALFVQNELSYDNHHDKKDRIYRVSRHGSMSGKEFRFAVNPAPLADAMVTELPEVEAAVRFRSRGTFLIKTEDMTESFKEDQLIFADAEFFNVFTVPILNGNKDLALRDPMSVAISRTAAEKYFGQNDPIGQTLILDGDEKYHVTAVYQDMPQNGHLQFDFLMSLNSLEESKNNNWLSNNFFTYVLLKENTDPLVFKENLNALAMKYLEPALEALLRISFEELENSDSRVVFKVQPLKEVYLQSDYVWDIGPMGDITYVYMFSAVAIFILTIACINFMNLSTARSSNRAREVGVRKVLGSYRSHIIKQFLAESILLCFVAFIVAIALASIALPFFNALSGKSMEIPLSSPYFYGTVLVCVFLIGTLAGIYPAFFLSAFKPINVLKGKLSLGSGSSIIRSSLVVFQFFISILLIIGTATVYQQLNYIQNKKLGFSKEQVLLISDTYMLDSKTDAFKKELLQVPQVKSASFSGYLPVSGYNRNDMGFWKEGEDPSEDNMTSMQLWQVDEDYINTLGIKIIHGRNFKKDFASDSTAVILNESAAKSFGFKLDETHKGVKTFDYNNKTGTMSEDAHIKYNVIGIIEDFHFESMKEKINPLGLIYGNSTGAMSIKFNTEDVQTVLQNAENIWKKFAPELPFNYTFLDSNFNQMYRSEQQLANVFTIFAGLAVIIGCLGLFALAAFMAEQRTKEIGIRKILGASAGKIVFMLSKEFSKLIIIAFAIAAPVAWWLSSQWLENYSYRVDVGVWIYLVAGLIAFIIAWLTVGYHSIKAAQANPVNSLRNE